MSYLLIAACIISTAQQANPKVSGQRDPERAQAITEINFVEIHSSFIIIYKVSNVKYFAYTKQTKLIEVLVFF
jgi:hypothetical protein